LNTHKKYRNYGANERDLAYSGLEDSMWNVFNEILQIKKRIIKINFLK
jgi:hypothetical protein